MRERTIAVLDLTRLHLAGWELFVFCLGPAAAGLRPTPVEWLWLGGLAVAFHAFSFALNDVADRDSDRLNPARRGSPLVDGRLGMRSAGEVVWLSLGVAVVMLVSARPPLVWAVAMGALIAVSAYGNVRQKRSRRVAPPVMDGLFGVAMGAPVVVAVGLLGGPVNRSVVLLAAAVYGLAVLLNVLVGNLKDLEADRVAGDTTTALMLGVRLGVHGLVFPPGYRRYVRIHLIVLAAALAGFAASAEPGSARLRVAGLTLGLAVAAASLAASGRLFSGGRRPAANGREPVLALAMGGLLAGVGLVTGWHAAAGLAAVVVGWDLGVRIVHHALSRPPGRYVGRPVSVGASTTTLRPSQVRRHDGRGVRDDPAQGAPER